MHTFYSSPLFNFESLRILTTAPHGGADVAEFLEALGIIRDNDPESWYRAWSEQAAEAEKLAHEAQRAGNLPAARKAFLRASNYTRASCYMMTGHEMGHSSERVAPILKQAVSLFHDALSLFNGPVKTLEIPYEDGTHLPAYLYLPPKSSRLYAPSGKIPLLINFIGADSIQEEIYYMFPAAGPELGYAVLTVEGPGQGLMLHEKGVAMQPDWERVSRAVLDYMFQYTATVDDGPDGANLDFDRIAVAGASLGAYFALRSATDIRYKACVAVDPVYDVYDFAVSHSRPTVILGALWNQGWIPNWLMDAIFMLGTRLSFQTRWELFTSARFLGAKTPVEILRAMQKYTLNLGDDEGSYLEHVKCPVFVTGGADAVYFGVEEHTLKVANRLPNQDTVEIWVGSSPGKGSLQAKMGAFALCTQRVFAFLDRHFDIERPAC